MSSLPVIPPDRALLQRWLLHIALATIAWMLVYMHMTDFADWMVVLLGLERGTHTAEAVHFFIYDTPKVLLLLTGVVFAMGVVHTFFTPERTRALLARERGAEITLEKVEDIQRIMTYRVMATPGVVIDGEVVHAGGVPARSKVEGWF